MMKTDQSLTLNGLETSINLKNCLKIKEQCETLKLNNKLLENCLNFINDNLMDILNSDEFLELSFKNIELFFTDPGTGCDNVPLIDLLSVLSKWVLKDAEERIMDYQKLLLIFNWSDCAKEEIFDFLKTNILFEESRLCLYFVLNTLDLNKIELDEFKETYLELKKIYENNDNDEKVKNDKKSTNHKSSRRISNRKDNKESITITSLAQWKDGVKCPKCTYIGHSAPRLEQHLAKVHQEDSTYNCKFCGFTCKWNREYYKHMKTHFTGPPFNCEEPDCNYTCDRVQFILSHSMKHTDERPFACNQCDFRSRTKGNLVVHYRIHTGEKPYKCQHCQKKFAMKNTLDQHMATHSEERPFLCDKCGFTTKYQSHLLSHKRIHSGNVFHCDREGCNYFSPRKSQLAAHIRSHLSIRNHACKTCGRAFIERSHLIRHERIHLEDKPFKCTQCDYGSTRRDKLKEHVQKHHNQNGNEKSFKPRKSRKQDTIVAQPVKPKYQYIQQVHFENPDQIPEAVQEQIIAHYQNQQLESQNVSITIGDNVYESQLIVTPVNPSQQIDAQNVSITIGDNIYESQLIVTKI